METDGNTVEKYELFLRREKRTFRMNCANQKESVSCTLLAYNTMTCTVIPTILHT